MRDVWRAHVLLALVGAALGAPMQGILGRALRPLGLRLRPRLGGAARTEATGLGSAAMFAGVRRLVSAAAVKVAPKEGDTVDRAKYYQGGWVGGLGRGPLRVCVSVCAAEQSSCGALRHPQPQTHFGTWAY